MEFKLEPSKWGPYIVHEGKDLFYDFFLDRSKHAKDLPEVIENPKITYHMWFYPKDLATPHLGDILGSRSLEGLGEELVKAKEKAIRDNRSSSEYETILSNLPKITTENYINYFLLR